MRSASSSQERRAARASSALRMRPCRRAPRPGQLALQRRDGRAELVDRALGAGECLGVGALPLGLLGPATASSTLRRPDSSCSRGLARHRARLLPALLDGRAARSCAGAQSVTGSSACASASSCSLTVAWRASSVSLAANTVRAGAKNLSWASRNRFHSSASDVAPGPARVLPLPHQVAVGARGGAPVGRGRPASPPRDQLLLADPDRLALGLQRREVGLAPLGEGVAGRGQPLPQHRLDGPVGVRRGLPLLEKLGHPLAAGLPVGGLGGDVLGLVDDPLLDPARLGAGVLAGGLDLLAALVDRGRQRLQAGPQPVQVAERVGVGDGCAAVAGRSPAPGRERSRSRPCAARSARPRSRASRTCAGRTQAPPLGSPPPTSRSPARHRRYARRPSRRRLPGPRDRWRWSRRTSWFSAAPVFRAMCVASQLFLIVTLSMTTFSLGDTTAGSRIVHEVPAFATFWRISRPEVIVPNGV